MHVWNRWQMVLKVIVLGVQQKNYCLVIGRGKKFSSDLTRIVNNEVLNLIKLPHVISKLPYSIYSWLFAHIFNIHTQTYTHQNQVSKSGSVFK